MTQSDLEWPRTAVEIVWMTQYDFRWVKSTSASPFWGPSDLNFSICSDSVTSQRETTILCTTWYFVRLFIAYFRKNELLLTTVIKNSRYPKIKTTNKWQVRKVKNSIYFFDALKELTYGFQLKLQINNTKTRSVNQGNRLT